ncbi:hypothetical protein TNCV_447861 [Trichonephila clavipes]|nr:hypothetical protein TNCV_447861 [Trichonephila clavipes]
MDDSQTGDWMYSNTLNSQISVVNIDPLRAVLSEMDFQGVFSGVKGGKETTTQSSGCMTTEKLAKREKRDFQRHRFLYLTLKTT